MGAAYAIARERKHPGFLPTMGTGLVTAPITLPLELLGVRLDLRRLDVVAALLAANASLVYCAVVVAAGLPGYASPFLRRSAR